MRYDRQSSIGGLDKGLAEAAVRGRTVVDMKKNGKRSFPGKRNDPYPEAKAMKIFTIGAAILVSLFFTNPLAAQGNTDVVVMKNGDRMTCEIKGLDAGVLFVSLDYVDGTISVQWSKVARLESTRLYIVKTENGLVYKGQLSTVAAPGGQPVKIEVAETPEKKVVIDTARVVTMDTTSKKLLQRFNGDISLGMTYAKGNDSTQYNFRTSVEYPADKWSFAASFDSTLSSSTGSAASKRNQLELRYQRLMRRRNYFYAGGANFLQSDQQGIDLQSTYSGGFGVFIKNTNRARISLIAGLAYQKTGYGASNTNLASQNTLAALIATDVKVFRFKKTNLSIAASLLPSLSESGRYFFKANASYYIKLFSNLSWNLTFYDNWDNRPPPGLSGSDFGTTTGLGWTFGNK